MVVVVVVAARRCDIGYAFLLESRRRRLVYSIAVQRINLLFSFVLNFSMVKLVFSV